MTLFNYEAFNQHMINANHYIESNIGNKNSNAHHYYGGNGRCVEDCSKHMGVRWNICIQLSVSVLQYTDHPYR